MARNFDNLMPFLLEKAGGGLAYESEAPTMTIFIIFLYTGEE